MVHQFFWILPILTLSLTTNGQRQKSFPEDFLFGTATSSYQIEGAWNVGGKSESTWDHFTHNHPEMIRDGSTGDISCDSYHNLEEDVKLLKELGVNFYRFSLSWSRILPSPLTNKVNPDGLRYYNKLIDLLLENGIQPLVTLYHWDLPQTLQLMGGFTNSLITEHFVRYAQVAFANFGDRVKMWTTINEPHIFCLLGYGQDRLTPAYNLTGVGEYLCAHNVLKTHAAVYHLYNNTFKPLQKGRIGINLDSSWFEPASSAKNDQDAAQRAMQFELGLYAHPIFSKSGDYPDVVKTYVAKRSKAEGLTKSRLPQFTTKEVDYIRGTYDMFCLNHYSSFMAAHKESDPIGTPSYDKDMDVRTYHDPSWPLTGSILNRVVPWGFTKTLVWIKEHYGNPDIYITENGVADTGELNDQSRVKFYQLYLNALLEAIYVYGVRVKGYTAWSLMDNFEWTAGFSLKFGLYHVDFLSPNRTRTAKASAGYFKKVITTRKP